MQKTKPSRSSLRSPPTSKEHRYIPAIFLDDFGISRKLSVTSASSFSKKKLAAAACRTVRLADAELDRAMRDGDRETALAIRRLRKRERAADRSISSFFRRRIKTVEPQIEKIEHQPKAKVTSRWPFREVALPRYSAVVCDSQKRRGVFMRVQYYGAKTSRPGVAMRACKYIFRGCALDEAGQPMFESNLGLSVEEALCGFDHVEQINRSAQKNAKVAFHTVLALDYRWSKEQQFQAAREWAEESFGKHGLPYAIALHEPDPDGDPRNWHAHIISSYRPMARVGQNEWDVGEALRTDLDNPESMQLLRENFARVMTRMSLEAGQCERYTALSHAARGLPVIPQQHLGEARTRMARAGEFVAANEENHNRAARSSAALAHMELQRVNANIQKQTGRLRAAMNRVATAIESPRLPSRLIVASKLTLPVIQPRPALQRATLFAAVVSPPRPINVSSIQVSSRQTTSEIPPLCTVEIANLRFPSTAFHGSGFSLPASPSRGTRMLAKAAQITAPDMPTLAPQSLNFTCPKSLIGPVPPILNMDEFPRPARVLNVEEEVHNPSVRNDTVPFGPAPTGNAAVPLELSHLMARLRKRKRLVRRLNDGFKLPADMLNEIGVAAEQLTTPAAQDLLRAEYLQQRDDLRRLARHLAALPSDLYAVTNGWRAHQDAPRDIREQLDLWLGEPRVQAAWSKLVTMHEVERDSAEHTQRANLLRDQIYRNSSQKPPPLGDDHTAPLGAAITTAVAEPKEEKETRSGSRSDDDAPRPAGKPFTDFDPGR